jgi:argininosuccinate synthase
VGRIDMVENRLLGIKSREIHEAPAAVVLHAAHRDLQAFVTTRELDRIARAIGTAYADLVYNGLWFTDARPAMDAFVASVQPRVSGDVRVKLFRGACQVVGRRSPHGVYDPGLSTYGDGDRFDHAAAEGFIRIWGLPVETAARASARVAETAVSPSSPADGG